MPLINCPDCNNSVSDSAENCQKCGFPIKNLMEKNKIQENIKNPIKTESNPPKPKNGCGTVVTVVIAFIFIVFLIDKCSSKEPEIPITELESETLSKEDSLKNVAKLDSINKQYELEEKQFLKTKAGKIYKKHPNWSKEDCKNLADNRIWIGMEYEMVVYMRGKPNSINTSNYGNGSEYQACWDNYASGCFYFGEDHIIKSYN